MLLLRRSAWHGYQWCVRKEIFVFMTVFIFDKDTAKLYVQYFGRKSPQI